MHHHMLGTQPIRNGFECRSLLCQAWEDRVVLDGMVRVDDLAVLPAQIAEPPIIGDHRHVIGLVGDLLQALLGCGRNLLFALDARLGLLARFDVASQRRGRRFRLGRRRGFLSPSPVVSCDTPISDE